MTGNEEKSSCVGAGFIIRNTYRRILVVATIQLGLPTVPMTKVMSAGIEGLEQFTREEIENMAGKYKPEHDATVDCKLTMKSRELRTTF